MRKCNVVYPLGWSAAKAKQPPKQERTKKEAQRPAGQIGFAQAATAPWETEVNLKALLGQIELTIKRHVVLSDAAAKALAAWVVHTYVFRQREAVAYVAIQSPEKRCGKTTLLSLLASMAARPLVASNISVGALFRAIDEAGPTLLIDEADTFLGKNSSMRGILNCGNTRRAAFVLRLARQHQVDEEREGPKQLSQLVKYSCWCPKVIAMIGKVPETLADRSIVVNMERKLTSVECVPLAELDPTEIVGKCVRWANDNARRVKHWPRQVLAGVSDRASDTFEPLLVIANMAGKAIHDELEQAARSLCAYENTEPEAASLLLDIMSVFIARETQRLFTRDLIVSLKGNAGWMAYDITSRQPVSELSVAKVLRRYHIRPTTVRVGAEVSKGYKWEQFKVALEHYVPKAEVEAKIAEIKEANVLANEAEKEKQAKEQADKEAQQAQESIQQVERHIKEAKGVQKALEELKDNLEIQTGKAPKADESGTKTPQVTSGNESVTPEIRVSPTDSTGVTA